LVAIETDCVFPDERLDEYPAIRTAFEVESLFSAIVKLSEKARTGSSFNVSVHGKISEI
jgi:hypothetical protein